MIIRVDRVAAGDFQDMTDPPTRENLINTDSISWIEPTSSLCYTRWFLNDGRSQLIVKASFLEVQRMFGKIFIL